MNGGGFIFKIKTKDPLYFINIALQNSWFKEYMITIKAWERERKCKGNYIWVWVSIWISKW